MVRERDEASTQILKKSESEDLEVLNPRRHKWRRHFRWNGPYLLGRTALGRVTIAVLAMNDPEVVEVRAALIEEGTLSFRQIFGDDRG